MKLNDKFKPLFTSNKRYFILTGGRGSSKSFHAKAFEALLTYEANHRILDTRYTLKSAQKSTIPELIEKIKLFGVEHNFHVTRDSIINQTTQSEIIFSGIKTSAGNQTANLKSLQGITTWVNDEAEELVDEKEFDTIDYSIRQKGVQNRNIQILNPTTKEHWIWQRWFENDLKYIDIDGFQIPVSTHPDICHIHTTYLDNLDNLHPDYIRQIKKLKETDPEKYRHIILGGWLEKAEGVIYPDWEEGPFDESLPWIYGQDYGFSLDPDTLARIGIDNKKKIIYIDEQMYQTSQGTKALIYNMGTIIKDKNRLIIADSAEPRTIEDIRQAGFNIAPAVKGPDSVRNGIKRVQGYKIIVTPNSRNTKKELNNYAWHDRKSETPIDAYNHILDPVRYVVDELVSNPPMFFG